MIEGHPYEDDATRYVLGLLNPKERREFEVRMTQSSELRALVRALETGTVATAMAVARRDPPTKVWEGIQNAIDQESQRPPVVLALGSRLLRSGWAVAACLLLGWFIYAFWLNHSPAPSSQPVTVGHEPSELTSGNPSPTEMSRLSSLPAADPPALGRSSVQRSALQASETAALRRRIAEMEARLAQLSQTLTQQQVLPPGSNQLTFFQFATTSADKGADKTAAPPPELRRALLLALARELGWLPPPQTVPETDDKKTDDGNPSLQNAQAGVEFVDLPPAGSDAAPGRAVYPPTEESSSTQPKTTDVAEGTSAENGLASPGAVPGFVSGTNFVFAINTSVVPSGTDSVTVWSFTGNGQALPRGNVAVGSGSTIVTVPFSSSSGGPQITITAGSSGANIIGQFPPPVSPRP